MPQATTKKNIITIFFLSFISTGFDFYWSSSSAIIILIIGLYILNQVHNTLLFKISIFLFCFLTTSLTANFSNNIVFNLLNLKSQNMTMSDSIVPFLLITFFNYLSCIIVILFFKKVIFKSSFSIYSKDKTITAIIFISIMIMSISYFCLILLSKHLKLNIAFLKVSLSISLISIIFIIIGTIFLITSRLKEIKISSEVKQMKERNIYIKGLERKNNELRRFKHDYKNFLLSLSASLSSNNIDNNSIQELLKYADTNIDSNLNIENSSLYHMNDELVKGIILTKLMFAKDKGIKTNFEIDDNSLIPKNLSVEITRILGILLDNAIDACSQTDKPELDFALVSFDDHLEFIVKNRISNKSEIDLGKIYNSGYTTKNNHSGLGLSTVKKIIDSDSRMLLQTKIDDKFFTIILTVLGED